MKQLRWEDFDAIAFDVEGTLADTIPTHHTARLEAFKEHGYGHITPEQHERGVTYGSSGADIAGGILHAAGHIEKKGPFKDHPQVQKILVSKIRLFHEMASGGFDEMPGAIDFVRHIMTKFATRAALVTSSPERFVLPFLERYGLAAYFPKNFIISEDTVTQLGLEGKPSPDSYRLAIERLEAKKSSRTLFPGLHQQSPPVRPLSRLALSRIMRGYSRQKTSLILLTRS